MIQTNVEAAQANLAQLIEKVLAGEVVVLERDGKALARIVRVEETEVEEKDVAEKKLAEKKLAEGYNPNWFGMDQGKIWMAEDFNELPEDILKSFYGEDE